MLRRRLRRPLGALLAALVACADRGSWAINSHARHMLPAFSPTAFFPAPTTSAAWCDKGGGACSLRRGGLIAPCARCPCRLPLRDRVRSAQGPHVLQMAVGGKTKAEGRAARLQKIYAEEEGLEEEDEEAEEKQQLMAPIAENERLSLIIDQQLLAQHLALVSRAVNPTVGRHYSILNNILLRADAKTNTLALAGYDLAMGIETRLREGVTVKQSGMVAAPAKVICEMIAKLPQGELELICETKTLLIRSVGIASHAYNIRVMPTDDFPALPAVQSEDIIMQGDHFLNGIGGVMYACAIDDSAALLKGAHIRLLPDDTETRVEFAATDGHRLAVHRMHLSGQLCPRTVSATVPRPTLLEVERLVRLASKGTSSAAKGGKDKKGTKTMSKTPIDPESSVLAIRIDAEYAQFVLGPRKGVWTAVRVFSRLFDGIFPNYDELMPRTYSRSYLLQRNELIEAVERLQVVAKNGDNVIKFDLDAQKQSLLVSAFAVGFGQGKELLACVQRDGPDQEPFSIAFNHKYLLDGLKVISTAQVKLLCTYSNSPAVFVPFHAPGDTDAQTVGADKTAATAGVSTGELEYLVMPMQLPSQDDSSWTATSIREE